MFGYLTIDRSEMKGKDYERYRMYYCGVCRDLKDSCGEKARMTLTYDMTFLAILLTSLYEGRSEPEKCRCILHPAREQAVIRNEYTAYAADMNLLLMYHNLMDDWIDEHNAASYAAARALRKPYLFTADKYPRQTKAIRRYLRELHQTEESRAGSIDLAAGQTGRMLGEIYVYREDFWSGDMRRLGDAIGRFIYLMDAWDDLEKDKRSGAYNPFLTIADDADYEEKAGNILTMEAAAATRTFERLPLLSEVDILRNILYSGIWIRYRMKKTKEKEEGKGR